MQQRQGTVTLVMASREAALTLLHAGYIMVHVDADGLVWRGVGHLVDQGVDGVTLTFRRDDSRVEG
jgi:hypothetical protein